MEENSLEINSHIQHIQSIDFSQVFQHNSMRNRNSSTKGGRIK